MAGERLRAIDRDRIEAAVSLAEQGSSGEIVCVLAAEVSGYAEIPLAWAAAAALALPPIALALGLQPLAIATGGWTAAHPTAAAAQMGLAIGAYAIVQAVVFALTALVISIPRVRRLLTPGALKRRRVRREAQQQFAAISARAQGSDTGVLLFVAVDDHLVEVLADRGIHEKAGESVWRAAADAVRAGMRRSDATGGIVAAVEICGGALREHFPLDGPRVDALRNRPVEI